jgi:hypothetical protein
MSTSFRDSESYASVMQVRNFMFEDIAKTLELRNVIGGAPNFLLALGLCCYTEYWGKLMKGIAKDYSPDAFKSFLVELGKSHYEPIKSQIYKNVRCGLAHSYMIEGNSIIDVDIMGPHGIEFDTISNTYTFFVQKYFEEFKKAVDNYITNLENNKEGITLLEQALVNKPELM